MRGCSGTGEYEAGKERIRTKKLDYTTAPPEVRPLYLI